MPQQRKPSSLDAEIDAFMQSVAAPKPAATPGSLDTEIDGFLSSLNAPAAKPLPSYGDMADKLRRAAPGTMAAPSSISTQAVEAAQRFDPNITPAPGQPLSPALGGGTPQDAAAAVARVARPLPITPTGPSLEELAENKTGRLGSAKTGGMATITPPGQMPIFDIPANAYEQAVTGAQHIIESGIDTTPIQPSGEPFRRARTGALYQPPPSLDSRAITGASELMEAGMTAATPLVAGAALTAPLKTAGALIKATAAAVATEKALTESGVKPETARFAADVVGGLAAGVPIKETLDSAVWSLADKTRVMADRANARRQAARTITPDPSDIVITPERPKLEADNPIGRVPVASEPRSPQGPTTSAPPVAVRPGEPSVGPVASSPVPPPAVATATPTSLNDEITATIAEVSPGHEFLPVRPEDYTGPERRLPTRVNTPDEDLRYAEMREKIARGEPTGTQAARDAHAERVRVDEARPEEPARQDLNADFNRLLEGATRYRPTLPDGTSSENFQKFKAPFDTTGVTVTAINPLSKGKYEVFYTKTRQGVADEWRMELESGTKLHQESAVSPTRSLNDEIDELLAEHGERINDTRDTTTGYDALNDHERRELGRILAEMQSIPFSKHTFNDNGVGKGSGFDIVPGNAGAPVFHDIGGGSRRAVIDAIARVLNGKKPTAIGKRAIDVARSRLKRDGHVSAPRFEEEAGNEPGKTYVEMTPDMTSEEAAAERPFRAAVEQRTPELVAEYVKRYGNVVDADKAKELSPEYAASNESRATLNRAVHRASSSLAFAVYKHLVEQPTPEGKDPEVIFVAGPTGAGKSLVSESAELKPVIAQAQVVVDGPLSSLPNAQKRIQLAIDAGKSVTILYVHRDPVTAYHDGVVPRGKELGRQPSLEYHVNAHVNGLDTIRRLADAYGDLPSVHIEILHNVPGQPVREISVDDLPEAYTKEDVRQAIEAAAPAAEARASGEERGGQGPEPGVSRTPRPPPPVADTPVTVNESKPRTIRSPRSFQPNYVAALKPFKGSDGRWYHVDTRQPNFNRVERIEADGMPQPVRAFYPGSGFYHDSIPGVTFEGTYDRPEGAGTIDPTTPTKAEHEATHSGPSFMEQLAAAKQKRGDTPVTPSGPEPIVFRSGNTRAPADLDGYIKAGQAVGVTHGMTPAVYDRIVAFAQAGGNVFVDSGAFGTENPDFDTVLDGYDGLLEEIGAEHAEHLFVVAPDKVGDAAASRALQERYIDRIHALLGAGVHVVVPVQISPSVIADAGFIARTFPDASIGIPSNKAAMSLDGLQDLLDKIKVTRAPGGFHFLGMGEKNPRFASFVAAVRARFPKTLITADSNRTQALMGKGRPAHDDAEQLTDERSDNQIDNAPDGDTTELIGAFYNGDLEAFRTSELEEIAEVMGVTLAQIRRAATDDAMDALIERVADERLIDLAIQKIAKARMVKQERPGARTDAIAKHDAKTPITPISPLTPTETKAAADMTDDELAAAILAELEERNEGPKLTISYGSTVVSRVPGPKTPVTPAAPRAASTPITGSTPVTTTPTSDARAARKAAIEALREQLRTEDPQFMRAPEFMREPDEAAGELAPTFYSRLQRAVEQATLTKASGQQWKATIKNAKGGINLGEFAYAHVDDLDNATVYTKQDVLDYLKANELKVEPHVLGSLDWEDDPKAKAAFDTIRAHGYDVQGDDDLSEPYLVDQRGDPVATDDAFEYLPKPVRDAWPEVERWAARAQPAYGAHVEPGGDADSYREVLLTMKPVPRRRITSVRVEPFTNKNGGTDYQSFVNGEKWIVVGSYEGENGAIARVKDLWRNDHIGRGTWVDGHNHYQQFKNPIVRLRFNVRSMPRYDAQTLDHLGQKVLEHAGYSILKPSLITSYAVEKAVRAKAITAEEASILADGLKLRGRDTTSAVSRTMFLEEVQPPQPDQQKKMPELLRKHWREIGFKWALRYAAEQGYDAVAWTTGEMQAARYSLEQQVDSITWDDDLHPLKSVNVKVKHSDRLFAFRVNPEGVIVSTHTNSAKDLDGKRLDEVIGKEVAERILTTHVGDLRGEGLKIGGEGLKKLYDVDFPTVVRNLPAVKRAGVKVETSPIAIPPKQGDVAWKPLTRDEAAAAITRYGLNAVAVEEPGGGIETLRTMFETGFREAYGREEADEFRAILRETNGDVVVEWMDDKGYEVDEWRGLSRADAKQPSVPTIAITPELRKAVLGGQALFARKPKSDLFDTGEEQPRLPDDVGEVRETETPTPELDRNDEFRLTSEVSKRKAKQTTLFMQRPADKVAKLLRLAASNPNKHEAAAAAARAKELIEQYQLEGAGPLPPTTFTKLRDAYHAASERILLAMMRREPVTAEQRATVAALKARLDAAYDYLGRHPEAHEESRYMRDPESLDSPLGAVFNEIGATDAELQALATEPGAVRIRDAALKAIEQILPAFPALKVPHVGVLLAKGAIGVFSDGRIYLNPFQAARVSKRTPASAASVLLNVILHEITHGTHPDAQGEAFAYYLGINYAEIGSALERKILKQLTAAFNGGGISGLVNPNRLAPDVAKAVQRYEDVVERSRREGSDRRTQSRYNRRPEDEPGDEGHVPERAGSNRPHPVTQAAVARMVGVVRLYLREGLTFPDAVREFQTDFGAGARSLDQHFELAWRMLQGPGLTTVDKVLGRAQVAVEPQQAQNGGNGARESRPEAETSLAGTSAEDDGGTRASGDAGSAVGRDRASDAGSGSDADSVGDGARPSPRNDAGDGLSAGGGRQRERAVGADYRIAADDPLGDLPDGRKFTDNVAALRLLHTLDTEGRKATPAEQATLVRYVGWGGLAFAFKPGTPQYTALAALLKDGTITQDEYAAMRASTPNAHYTSRAVVTAMYDAVARLGFTKGRVLEPSTGAGHFFGLMPDALANRTTWAGVELDPVTARIAQQLYQSANIQATGYEQAILPAHFFDLAIGNPPFGNYQIHDPAFAGARKFLTKAIHNYFFAKTLDVVRPGGLVAFVTSHFTMDAQNSNVRQYLDRHAELLGAIRLPNTAFKRNAGTEVVTDILFLKKRDQPRESDAAPSAWVEARELAFTGAREGSAMVNAYFLANPRMVLGRHALEGSQYSEHEYTVEPTGDLAEQLAAAIALLPEKVITAKAPKSTEPSVAELIPAPGHVKPFAFTKGEDGKLYMRDGANLVSVEDLPDATKARIRGLMGVRDVLRETMRTMLSPEATDADVAKAQKALNKSYDHFVARFGAITSRGNIQAFSDDPDKPLLLSLEEWDHDTEKAKKAAIFTKRVLSPRVPVTSADSPTSALMITLNEHGRIEWDRMTGLTGQTVEQLQQALTGLVFESPAGEWQPADEYLSGNVRAKLLEARAAAKVDAKFKANVEALEKVQPEDLGPRDIDARLGTPWVPPSDVEAFIRHVTGGRATVRYVPPLASWTVRAIDHNAHGSVAATDTYGTRRKDALELITLALNLKQPTVYDQGPNHTSVVNPKETLAAREKQQKIKDLFKKWLWEDPDRGTRLARYYNDHFNNLRLRVYDGAHLTLPGMAAGITLRAHQLNFIWRAIVSGNALAAHVVGAGKTFALIGAAMEMRRLGIAKKPLITVPNHLVEQWGAEFNRMYPTAKLLIATKRDFEGDRRKRLMARIATGDWDTVVVAHASFGRIPVSDKTFTRFINEQIEVLERFIEEEKAAGGKAAPSVKELEKAKKRLKAKLDDRRNREKQDDTVNFEDLGVDALFVDEAHMFKNLWFPTKMTRVAGLPNSESDRAFDMFLKTRYVQQVTNGRGIVFATGTPISNTMAEMFTMQRYLAARQLEAAGLGHFDAWAQQFGEVVSAMELAPEGRGYRVRNRFARFTNFGELAKMFRSFADVQTAEMLNLPTPTLKGGVPTLLRVAPSDALKRYVDTLVTRAGLLKSTKVDPKVDNMLKITGDGRKAALDLRLVGLAQPPGGKIDVAAERIVAIYKEHAAHRGTQLVFSDLGTPKPKGKKKPSGADATATVFDADDSGFNVYETLKDKLVASGIPAKEVAFIHDADTDARKLALFNDVRNGRVRVLIGSTEKMGAGMNVQNRLVVKHDLDAPWRPSDVEQRDGRIIRQGNELFDTGKIPHVEVIRYIAEGSFDAYMWQILESKAKFINQAMSGDINGRSVEDVDVVMINSAAEAKAIASGNPLVFEKVKIDSDVAKLESLRSSWEDSRYRLRNDMATLPRVLEAKRRDLADIEAMQAAVALPNPWSVTIGKKSYSERKDGGERLIAVARKTFMESLANGVEKIGTFAGLDIMVRTVEDPKQDYVGIPVMLRYEDATVQLGHVQGDADPVGWTARLMNGVAHIDSEIADARRSIERMEARVADAKAQADEPWENEAKLAEALVEQERINKLLDLDAASQAAQAPAAADDDAGGDAGTGGVNAMPITTGPPNAPLPRQSGTPITPSDRMRPSAILERLRTGLGAIPINVGRFRQPAHAIYKQKPQAIRSRVANDVQAVVHELGHHVDHTILEISRRDKRWRDELQALGQATSRPAYTAAQQRQEGAAEFLRLYLIEPARASAEAPEYFAEFERKLADHPDLTKVLHDARTDLAGLIAQDPATRGRLRIDFTGDDSGSIYQQLKENPRGALRSLATAWVDDLHALRVAVEEMRDARPIDVRHNAYVLARNARGTGGMAEGMLEHGVRGRNGRFITGSFADAITPVREHLEDFAAYLVALRVIEVRTLKRKETGIALDEARAIVRQVEEGPHADVMARARDNVYAYQQGLLQYAREYHALSPELFAKLTKEVNYVPLQRVRDAVGSAFGNTARKLANRSTPVKRLKGSGRDIINPLESIIRNTFAIVDTVEKNRAMQALVRQAENAAGSAKWLERVPNPQVATKFNLSQVEQTVREELDDMGIELPADFDLDAFVTVFTPANFAMPGQNLVTVLRKGKREFWEVHDQALYDAVLAVGGTVSSKLIEWASKPAALVRAGATMTPGFIARNPTRDTLVAFMQSRYGFIPVYDTVRGFLSLVVGDEDAKLFLTSGVQQSSLVGADRDRIRKAIRAMPESSRKAFFKNIILHPIDMLRALSENMEAATRLGEFRLALNAGGVERHTGALGVIERLTTPNTRTVNDDVLTRATLAARDVTTDFSRGGSISKEISRVKAFFNARVGGYVRMAETAANDPTGTVLNVTLLAILSYALWWANQDDDEYAEIPDWEKNAYWHIPANLLQRAGVRKTGFFKVAKPFEWAYLANLTEAALTHIKGKDPDALNRIKPGEDPRQLAFALIPSALLPVLETSFNYDTFRDTNIVKPWDVNLQPDQQKSDWTTATATELGKLLHVAPAKIDHVVFGYGAGFARGIVDYGTDPVLRILKAAPGTEGDPTKKWQRMPIAGTFYREGSYDGGAQSLRDFYAEYERMVSGERSLTRYAKNDPVAGRTFAAASVDARWHTRATEIKAAKQELENLGDVVNAIYAAPPSVATPDQKRAALDRVYERMVDAARFALGKPARHGATPVTVTPAAGRAVGQTPITR